MKTTLSALLILSSVLLFSQKPVQLNSSEIYQNIKKLSVLGNVLYLAAHPDDENTRFISYCANEKLFNTAYLSLTRGDGGQNLIGTEIREELGMLRTQELLAARRTDGGQQFFSRANDFGYSKNPEETFQIWNKDEVLSDVVWVIRKFQPDVIVCRFPDDGGGGHGHHTASALLAQEAFKIANDSTIYPDQLKFVEPWQPVRVVTNTGRWWNDTISADDPGVVVEDIGLYNEALGISYNELAALSRSQHKCQGFGSTGKRGSHIEYFEHVLGVPADTSLFEGFEPTWNRIEGGEKIAQMISHIITNYQIDNPAASIKSLISLKKEMFKLKRSSRILEKVYELDELIKQCAGIYIEAKADTFSKSNGDSLFVELELINRSGVDVKYTSVNSTELSFESVLNLPLNSNDKVESQFQFKLKSLPISQPYWLEKEFDLGMYNVTDLDLIGKAENDAAINFSVTLNIEGESIVFYVPLTYKWNDPVKGELHRPFIVTPKVTVNVSQPIALFSDLNTKTIELNVKSHTTNQKGALKLELPKGWMADYDGSFDFKNKGEEKTVIVKLTPSRKAENGDLTIKLNNTSSTGLNTIAYDHVPTQVWFPKSKLKLVYVELLKKGNKLGYIEGAGDVVPDALRNIGYQVDILKEEDLILENLKQYDAILTGIRFFNVNKRSPYMAPKLMEYVENGGNLIVQYNTRHRMKTQDFGPYPIKLSRDRVTEEDSKVKFLEPKHPVLNSPNKITQKDFENWVQERGLYFPDQWDKNYKAILSWHDKNESPKNGSLLVTEFGKGAYIYTGVSFFRELPAGVSGAYRLLVNLISYGQE